MVPGYFQWLSCFYLENKGEAKPLLAESAWPPDLVLKCQGSVLIVVKSGHMTDHSEQGIVADRCW